MPSDTLLYRFVLSKANYWIGFGLDIALGMTLVVYGVATHGLDLSTLIAVLAGWLVFSFTEYGIHRWGYHGPDSVLSRVHVFHHTDPHAMVGVPLIYPIAIWAVLSAIAQLFAPFPLVAVFGGTILVIYEAQTFAHAISHKWVRVHPQGTVKRLCRHHMIHHAGDGSRNFGMSTTLWDHLLGTYAARVERDRPRTTNILFRSYGALRDRGQWRPRGTSGSIVDRRRSNRHRLRRTRRQPLRVGGGRRSDDNASTPSHR
jgi:sterol desaturase/sphingolipid hydroxylase (fatty acid hydroxylase superfamily)